jgi:hypothetical protein
MRDFLLTFWIAAAASVLLAFVAGCQHPLREEPHPWYMIPDVYTQPSQRCIDLRNSMLPAE